MAFVLKRKLRYLEEPLALAPLVNVILLLLAFFLISSSFVQQSGFHIDLPRSGFGSNSAATRLVITVVLGTSTHAAAPGTAGAKDLFYFFNDQLATLPQIQRSLRHLAQSLQEKSAHTLPPIILKSDAGVPMGRVIEITNAILAEGFSVVLATQTP